MKVAIVIPDHRFSKSVRKAIPHLAYAYAQRSAFRSTIQFFCGWVPDPLDPKANMLPQTIHADVMTENEAWPLFADWIRRFQPDVVEIHQNFRIAFYLADVLPHLPVVLYSHAPNNNLISIKNHNFAHIVCVSHTSAQEAAKHLPTTKFTVIHNALATEGWIAKESEKENIILFCGRIVSHKGIQQFIEAAAAIKSQFTDWRFVVLGRVGQNKKDFFDQQKEMFQNLLGDQGLWIENALLEQVQTWIKKAKISVAPSDWEEVFPLSLLEMHMASCGVISSGRGGMKEVSSLDGALYLKEISAAAIAESMRFLIENEPERKALARRGHEYVMRHHRIDDRVAELDALRHQIIQRFKQEKGIWRRIRNLIKSSMGALG